MKTVNPELAKELGIDPDDCEYLATEEEVIALGAILDCPHCNQQYPLEEKDVVRLYLPGSNRYVRWGRIRPS